MRKGVQGGVWNVGTGTSTSIMELMRVLEAQIGPAVEVRHGSPRPGDVNDSRLSIDLIAKDLGWRHQV